MCRRFHQKQITGRCRPAVPAATRSVTRWVCANSSSVAGRAALSTSSMLWATTTATPRSRSNSTNACAPCGPVESGSICPPGARRGEIGADGGDDADGDQRERYRQPWSSPHRGRRACDRHRTGAHESTAGCPDRPELTRRRTEPQMVVEIGDHLVGRRRSWVFAVGDVVERVGRSATIRAASCGRCSAASRASSLAVRPGAGSKVPLSSRARATARSRCRIAAVQFPSAAQRSAMARCWAALS